MKLTIETSSNKKQFHFFPLPLPLSLSLTFTKSSSQVTLSDLKSLYLASIGKHISITSLSRLSFKKDEIRLEDDTKTLASYDVNDNDTLQLKDLGPQIRYQDVFMIEYLGPILFMIFYLLRPSLIYGDKNERNQPYTRAAMIGIICWILHFLKREYETFFIHKFSRPTMPLQNLFKNCGYYWSFGAVIGYPLCHPDFKPPSSTLIHTGFAIFLLSEIGNLVCHIMLSNLRPNNSKERRVPSGFLFNYVSCPNYTFEVLSWVGFSIMTQIPFAYLFTLIGFLQMADWALKKHRGYLKSHGDEYKKLRRKAIVPFLL